MTFRPLMSDFSAAQKEARALLRSLQRRDLVAAGRYSAFDAFDVSPTRLSDAQYLVARHYGFKSWAALKSTLSDSKAVCMPQDRPERPLLPAIESAEDLLHLQAAALEAAANPMLMSKRDGTIIWVNAAFERHSGYTRAEVIGQTPNLFKSGQHPSHLFKQMWEAILSGHEWRGELVNRRKDGSLYSEDMTITPVGNKFGEITHFIAVKLDITDRTRIEEQHRQLASTDALTGLANYRRLVEALQCEIHRYGRTARSFAVLLLDLDGLKQINDAYGHLVGSRALTRVANILRMHCRAVDTAARYGGDEFAVVLPETEFEAAQHVARRICNELLHDGQEPSLSLSAGTAVYPQHGETINELLGAADRVLYREKRFSSERRSNRVPETSVDPGKQANLPSSDWNEPNFQFADFPGASAPGSNGHGIAALCSTTCYSRLEWCEMSTLPVAPLQLQYKQAGMKFLLTELDLAITFCKLGLTTRDSIRAERNADHSRAALKAILQAKERLSLNGQETETVSAKTSELAVLMVQLERRLTSGIPVSRF